MWWITLLAIAVAIAIAFAIAPKGWRTIFANIAVAIGAVIPAIIDYLASGAVNLSELLPPSLAIYLIPGINILNMILRRITTTPIGQEVMIGGRILRKVGGIIFGRIRERVTDRVIERIEERFDETDPSAATAGPPVPRKTWEPPPWLALIVKVLTAILDYVSKRMPGAVTDYTPPNETGRTITFLALWAVMAALTLPIWLPALAVILITERKRP